MPASSGDHFHIYRQAAPGKFFGLVSVIDTESNSESYNNISQDYSRHCVVWAQVEVQPTDFVMAFASGQIDQLGVTAMEVVHKLEILHNGVWHEMSEEVGVNINGRTSHNVSEQADRHHEDFSAVGFFNIPGLVLSGPASPLIGWCFRSQSGSTSAGVPADSCRLIVQVWREFKAGV